MARKRKLLAPSYRELIEPLFIVIKNLGGSATNNEIRDNIIKTLNLSDKIVNEVHKGDGCKLELDYQLAWAKTYLKKYGAITNTQRGIWIILPNYAEINSIDGKEVDQYVRNNKLSTISKKQNIDNLRDDDPANDGLEPPSELESWRNELSEILHNMNPYKFEKLAQLLLRECGFTQVTVTKKSNDGGIDGSGKLRINGIFSFNVAFQCKRYTGNVSAADIRDFRGSLTTDIEKGVLITTGSFTKAAREEACNAGKQQIDLIDGEELINKLIEFGIGVNERTIYEIDYNFFDKI